MKKLYPLYTFQRIINILSSYVKNVCDFSYLVWRVMYSIKRLHVVDIEENIQILTLHYVIENESCLCNNNDDNLLPIIWGISSSFFSSSMT